MSTAGQLRRQLRLPEAGRGPGWLSTLCLTVVGVILLVYREA